MDLDPGLLVPDLALPERGTEHGHLHAQQGEWVGSLESANALATHVTPELEDELALFTGRVPRGSDRRRGFDACRCVTACLPGERAQRPTTR